MSDQMSYTDESILAVASVCDCDEPPVTVVSFHCKTDTDVTSLLRTALFKAAVDMNRYELME